MAVNLTVEPEGGSNPLQALRLRPWQPGDLADLLAAHRDPLLRRWALVTIDDEAAAARWIDDQHEQWAAGARYSFAIVTPSGGDLVGGVGVKDVEPDTLCAEVGYWVVAAHRGQGIAPRALEAVSQWALDPDLPQGPGLERLELLHSVDNEPSCVVAEKAGYTLASELPPLPPRFPAKGHLHARTAGAAGTAEAAGTAGTATGTAYAP